MSDVREILFPTYPRMVGNPKQVLVYNRDDLNRFAAIQSSDNDKNFASSCSYYNNSPVFEDNFIETDELNPEPVRKVALWYDAHGIPWIALLSANRGIHIHGLMESEIVNLKTVKKFADMVISETNTLQFFDPHVTGDLKRLCRIPNTQRLGNGWCVPITREELFTINDEKEFKKLCIAPRFLDFKIGRRPSIFEFVKEEIDENITPQVSVAPPKEIFFIKDLLRPCVYEAIITPNPRHYFRMSAVIELLNHGITDIQILRIFEKLHWIDFDHAKTRYQIDKIIEKRKSGDLTIPFGKIRLGCDKKISCIRCVLTSN